MRLWFVIVLLCLTTLISVYASYALFRIDNQVAHIARNEAKAMQLDKHVDKLETKTIILAKLLYVLTGATLELNSSADLSTERKFDIYYQYVAPIDFETLGITEKYLNEDYAAYSLDEFLEDVEKNSVGERIKAYHAIFLRFIDYKESIFEEVESLQAEIPKLRNRSLVMKKQVFLVFLVIGYAIFILNIVILIQTQYYNQNKTDLDSGNT